MLSLLSRRSLVHYRNFKRLSSSIRAGSHHFTFVFSLDIVQQELQAAFRDPTSPFHIPEGSQGPASPDEQPTPALSASEQGRIYFESRGFDPTSFWEQPIVWGDHDAFQYVTSTSTAFTPTSYPSPPFFIYLSTRHVNNVRYGAHSVLALPPTCRATACPRLTLTPTPLARFLG
jgi:hypothetical protein